MRKQRRKIILFVSFVLLLSTLFSVSIFSADTKNAKNKRIIHTVEVILEGEKILNGEAYLISGITYIPLRSICDEMGDAVEWDEKTRTASVRGINMEARVTEGKHYIEVNGRYFYCQNGNIIIDGRIYVPIRVISKAYGLDVLWEMTSRGGVVHLEKTGKRADSAENTYDADVLYWLSRIISAESRGESLEGQIAVGNVVMNRARHESFPDTVYDVIFDKKFGVQFTPTVNGTIYEEPYEISVIAAKICLEGYTMSEDIIYFLNIEASQNLWVPNNRDFVMTLGCHTFYS